MDESDIFDFSELKKNVAKNEELTINKNVQGSASKISEKTSSNSKKITETANENFGNLFLGKSQGKPVDLGAKKLDINFDCDDFFNQFDPAAVKKEPITKKAESTPQPIKINP